MIKNTANTINDKNKNMSQNIPKPRKRLYGKSDKLSGKLPKDTYVNSLLIKKTTKKEGVNEAKIKGNYVSRDSRDNNIFSLPYINQRKISDSKRSMNSVTIKNPSHNLAKEFKTNKKDIERELNELNNYTNNLLKNYKKNKNDLLFDDKKKQKKYTFDNNDYNKSSIFNPKENLLIKKKNEKVDKVDIAGINKHYVYYNKQDKIGKSSNKLEEKTYVSDRERSNLAPEETLSKNNAADKVNESDIEFKLRSNAKKLSSSEIVYDNGYKYKCYNDDKQQNYVKNIIESRAISVKGKDKGNEEKEDNSIEINLDEILEQKRADKLALNCSSKRKREISHNSSNYNKDEEKFKYFQEIKPVTEYSEAALAIIENKNGLQNLGNTCFMNTCLQLLIHSPNFIQRLIDFYPNNNILRSTKISKAFYNLCKEQSNSSCAGVPSDFKSAFGSNHYEYRGYSQQDTQEFCRFLLEDISKELNKVSKIPPYKEIDDKNKTKLEINLEYTRFFRGREDSIVVDTFYAKIINIFTCKCGFESYSFQFVLDLPLLPKSNSGEKIENLIEEYFESDRIEWAAKCEKCGKRTEHEKNMRLAYAPEILILSLQRYNQRLRRKNTENIKYKEELDMSKFIDKECYGSKTVKYNLIGIGNHSGSLSFGHYYAYVKINEKWYEFNDSRCYPLGNIREGSETAYVLFYKRID